MCYLADAKSTVRPVPTDPADDLSWHQASRPAFQAGGRCDDLSQEAKSLRFERSLRWNISVYPVVSLAKVRWEARDRLIQSQGDQHSPIRPISPLRTV